jgi:hypothetical protein
MVTRMERHKKFYRNFTEKNAKKNLNEQHIFLSTQQGLSIAV